MLFFTMYTGFLAVSRDLEAFAFPSIRILQISRFIWDSFCLRPLFDFILTYPFDFVNNLWYDSYKS